MNPDSERPSIDRLWSRCLADETAAWRELHHELRPHLTAIIGNRLARARLRDAHQAEDLFQDLFVCLLDMTRPPARIAALPETGEQLLAVLRQVAHNLAWTWVRSRHRRRRAEHAAARADAACDAGAEVAVQTGELLDRLPPALLESCLEQLGEGKGPATFDSLAPAQRQRLSRLRASIERFLASS